MHHDYAEMTRDQKSKPEVISRDVIKRITCALAHLNLSIASFKCLNAFDVLCAQLTRDLLAIAKFLLLNSRISARYNITSRICL